MSIIVAFLIASVAAGPEQQTTTTTASAAPAAAPAKSAKEKKICKVDPESDPGSHMVKHVCRTEQEWSGQGVLGSGRSGFSVSGDRVDGSH